MTPPDRTFGGRPTDRLSGRETPIDRASGGATLDGGWREWVAALAGGAALAICLTYPFAFQMGRTGRVDSTDGEFSIWNVAWVARTLVVDPRHVLDANIFYPHLGTLLYSETNLGAGALAIPAYWATRNPVFAINFVFLLSVALSFTGGYYLVRYLVGNRRAAVVAAICFGFCPYVFGHTPHIQLLMTAGLPFSMLAFHRAADRPSAGRGIVLGLVMAAQTAFCGYYSVFVILLVGFATLAVPTLRGWWTNGRYWRMVAAATVTAALAVSPLAVPYLQFQQASGFRRDLGEAIRYSADWRAYLASNAVAHQWILPLIKHWQEVLFPGFVATLGGAAGLVLGWTRGGRLREVAIIYGTITMLAFWASFGPQAGLYTVMYRVIPLFSSLRAPSRFGLIVALGVAVLTGVALGAWFERVRRPSVVGVLLVIVAAADLAVPLTTDVFREVPPLSPAYALLRTLPTGPVVEFPFWSSGSELHGHARYMRYSTSHWMPLINGYSDYIPPDFIELAPAVQGFPSLDAFQALAVRHARYAVFHMSAYGDQDRAALTARLNQFASCFAPLYIDDETRLYEIVKFPSAPRS